MEPKDNCDFTRRPISHQRLTRARIGAGSTHETEGPWIHSLTFGHQKRRTTREAHTLQVPARSTHPLATLSPNLDSQTSEFQLNQPNDHHDRSHSKHFRPSNRSPPLPRPTDSAWTPRRYEPLLTDSRILSHCYYCCCSIHQLHPFTRPPTARPLTLSKSKPPSRDHTAIKSHRHRLHCLTITVSPFTAIPSYLRLFVDLPLAGLAVPKSQTPRASSQHNTDNYVNGVGCYGITCSSTKDEHGSRLPTLD